MNRLPDQTFDQRIADWLEDDPTFAPPEVLGTVFAAFPSIEQRRASRVPWRLPTMFTNRLSVAALATVLIVAAGGGLYLVGLRAPNAPGGPRPTATQLPTPTPIPSIDALGTITLRENGCTWDANPGTIGTSYDRLGSQVHVRNETDTFANFGLYRLDEGYPWEEAAAWVRQENSALHGGPSNPPAEFVTDVGSRDQPTRGESPWNLSLGPGIYGIVCSSNEPPPGAVFAVYLVGPLEVAGP